MSDENKPVPLIISKIPKNLWRYQEMTARAMTTKRLPTQALDLSSDTYTYSEADSFSSSDDFIPSPKTVVSPQQKQITQSMPVLPVLDVNINAQMALKIPIPDEQNQSISLDIQNLPSAQNHASNLDDSKLVGSEASSSTGYSESYEANSSRTQSASMSGHLGTHRQNIIKGPQLNDEDVISENISEDNLSVNDFEIAEQIVSLPIEMQNKEICYITENVTPILKMGLHNSAGQQSEEQKSEQQKQELRPFSLDLQQIQPQSTVQAQYTARISSKLSPISGFSGHTQQQKSMPGLLSLPKLPMQDQKEQPQIIGPPPLETRQIKQQKLNEMSGLLCQITDYLYLSGLEAAQTATLLKEKKITHVINLCGDVCMRATCHKIKYLVFNVKDSVTESLSDLFYHCCSFIEQARTAGGRALIHCHQGVSRSASVAIAYLMFCNNLEFIDAFAHVRTCRPIAQPNTGFIFQITEMYRQRHFTLIRQMISAQIIKEKLAVKQLIERKKVVSKDPVLRDLSKFGFSHVRHRAIKGTLPVVYYLDQISKNQPVMLFRNDQVFSRKLQQRYDRNLKKNRVGLRQQVMQPGTSNGQTDIQNDIIYKLESNKLYVVAHLPIGTVIIIGKNFNRQREDGSIMVLNKQYQEMLSDVAPMHLKKPNQFHLINKRFRAGEVFKKQIDIGLADFSTDVKKHVVLFLTELLYFENIHKRLLFFEQSEIEKRYEELCNEQIFQYLMTKLLFFDARVNNDWEHACERARLQNPDIETVTNEALNESGFYLFSNCQASDIFQGPLTTSI